MFSKKPIQYPIFMDTTQTRSSGSASVAHTGIPPSITSAVNGNQPLFIPYTQGGGGGGSNVSSFTNLYASTVNTSTITADIGFINTVSSLFVNLDGNILTTDKAGGGGELLLNGVPIATTANLSNIGDWSLYPAVSAVNFETVVGANDGQLLNVSTINGLQYIPGTGELVSDWATYPALSNVNVDGNSIVNPVSIVGKSGSDFTIQASDAQALLFKGVNVDGIAGQVSILPNGTIDFGNGDVNGQLVNVSTINGTPFVSGGVNTIAGTNTFMTALGTATGQFNTSAISAEGGFGGSVSVVANPGDAGIGGGNISLTANGGVAPSGLYGKVSIIANQGVGNPGTGNVTTGGYINIQANSGSITSPTLTSRIDLNAGGLNLYSGITSPITSEFGYTFINALTGIAVVAGSYTSAFQVPGTVYLYGANGVVLGSDTYATNFYPYWNGLAPPANLTIHGRTTISGSASVVLSNVATMSMEGSGAISGVNTINGSSYPPSFTVPANINVSTIGVGSGGSINFTSDNGVITGLSTINGVEYPQPVILPADVNFSTIGIDAGGSINFTAIDGLGTGVVTNVSTINAIEFNDHDIRNVGQLQVQDGFTLDGGGTITINGSSGSAGQVIGIAVDSAYPAWIDVPVPPPPASVTSINAYIGDVTVEGGGGVTVTNAPSQTITVQTTGGTIDLVESLDQSISIVGLTTTGSVMLSFVGGAGATINWVTSITNTTDTCSFVMNSIPSPSTDKIVWMVVSYV